MLSLYDSKDLSYGICNVEENYEFYFNSLLSKLDNLFIWHNLPDSIDEVALNRQLFINGYTCFTDMGTDKLYAMNGLEGEKPNEYYMPTAFTVANPILGSKVLRIREIDGEKPNAVMMYNSRTDEDVFLPCGRGLYQLIKITATLLADNITSISCAQINSRVQAVATAESEAQAISAEKVIKDMYMGKPYRVVTEDELEKVTIQKVDNSSSATIIAQLVELQQYIIGQFYMAIGIKYNQINKKERLITDEINFQDQFLEVNIDVMLKARQEACEKINEMFGTNISVEINPILNMKQNEEGEIINDSDTFDNDNNCDNDCTVNDDNNDISENIDTGLEEDNTTDAVRPDTETESVEEPEEMNNDSESVIENLTDSIENLTEIVEELIVDEPTKEVTEDETV